MVGRLPYMIFRNRGFFSGIYTIHIHHWRSLQQAFCVCCRDNPARQSVLYGCDPNSL